MPETRRRRALRWPFVIASACALGLCVPRSLPVERHPPVVARVPKALIWELLERAASEGSYTTQRLVAPHELSAAWGAMALEATSKGNCILRVGDVWVSVADVHQDGVTFAGGALDVTVQRRDRGLALVLTGAVRTVSDDDTEALEVPFEACYRISSRTGSLALDASASRPLVVVRALDLVGPTTPPDLQESDDAPAEGDGVR